VISSLGISFKPMATIMNALHLLLVVSIISIMAISTGTAADDSKTQLIAASLRVSSSIAIAPSLNPVNFGNFIRGQTNVYDNDDNEDIPITNADDSPWALYVRDLNGNGKMRLGTTSTYLTAPLQVAVYGSPPISISGTRQKLIATTGEGPLDIALSQAIGTSTINEPNGQYSITLEWYLTTNV